MTRRGIISQKELPLPTTNYQKVMQPRFRENPFYAKLTTFSTAMETKSETKPVNDSDSKSKIKAGSRWTVFLILLMPAVICV